MKLTLIRKEPFAEDIISFVFEAPAVFKWLPGQYMKVTLPHDNPDDRGMERWFTIAAAPHERLPRITTRIVDGKRSSFKDALNNLAIGDTIEADEPEGDFILGDENSAYVFIAGGIGITPFHAILSELDYTGAMPSIHLLHAVRDDDPPFRDEIAGLTQKHPQFTVDYIVSPAQLDADTLRHYIPDMTSPLIYVSGPEPMVEELDGLLQGMGAPADHLRKDYFPGYSAQL